MLESGNGGWKFVEQRQKKTYASDIRAEYDAFR
jgi:hypothetical protein